MDSNRATQGPRSWAWHIQTQRTTDVVGRAAATQVVAGDTEDPRADLGECAGGWNMPD